MSALGNVTTVLASAVADGATVTVAYPTGTNQGLLIGSTGGKVAVNDNDVYPQDQAAGDNTVAFTFGASNITITNNSGVTWAVGSTVTASFGSTANDGSYNPDIRVDAIVALTAATGTASDTIADVGAAFSQTTLNNNFKSVSEKINEVIAALKTAGILID